VTTARAVTAALKGRWFGHYGYVCCPAHKDGRPSLRIRDGEQGRLLVHCHAGCDRQAILDRLRCERALPAAQVERDEAAERAQALKDAKRKHDATRRAFRMWADGMRLPGTPAEAYLRGRGISIPLPPSIRAARFKHPDLAYESPCLMAAMMQPDRTITGVHVIYLTAKGQKEAVGNAKLSHGNLSGAAVRLAPAAPVMAVGEGIETCLSFMQLTGIPTWAALNTSGLRNFTPPAGCEHLHILVDNDSNDAGHKAAEALTAKLAIACEWRRSTVGKDWNDAVMAASVQTTT